MKARFLILTCIALIAGFSFTGLELSYVSESSKPILTQAAKPRLFALAGEQGLKVHQQSFGYSFDSNTYEGNISATIDGNQKSCDTLMRAFQISVREDLRLAGAEVNHVQNAGKQYSPPEGKALLLTGFNFGYKKNHRSGLIRVRSVINEHGTISADVFLYEYE